MNTNFEAKTCPEAYLQQCLPTLQAQLAERDNEIADMKQQVLEQQAHIRLLHTKLTSYGPRCRDCADEDGICPTYGIPCDWNDNLSALEYALKAERLAGKIEGMEEAATVCDKQNPHPDEYSDQSEYTAKRVAMACAKDLRRMAAELKDGK